MELIYRKEVCWGREKRRKGTSILILDGLSIVYEDLKRSLIRNLLDVPAQQLQQPVEFGWWKKQDLDCQALELQSWEGIRIERNRE